MEYGPWKRASTGDFLYTFSSSDDEYSLLVTDMQYTFEERLNSGQIESRGEQFDCPFSLDSEQQRKAFGGMLAELLPSKTAVFNLHIDSTVIVRATDDIAFHWKFELHKLPSERNAEIFAAMAIKLFGVVANLGGQLRAKDQQTEDRNALIRGLRNANSRKVDYDIPRALESVYSAAIGGIGSSEVVTDPVDLAHIYWPAKMAPIVVNETKEETDSDATHESLPTSGSQNIWAGSFDSTNSG